MLSTIEGIGNVFNLRYFVCPDTINRNIDTEKLEEKILQEAACEIQVNEAELHNGLMDIFNNDVSTVVKIDYTPASESESDSLSLFSKSMSTPAPIPTPTLNIEKPKINKLVAEKPKINIDYGDLKKTLDQKQNPAPIMTDYDRKKFKLFMPDNNEEKFDLLESVRSIREELVSIPGTLSGIPEVTESSHIDDIRAAHKLLLHKKNKHINYETVKDIVMIGINKLTSFCDGSNGRPNLNGWDRTAKYKLSCLKHELSNIASDFYKKYNISPLFQIMISLVPSALVYMGTSEEQNKPVSNNTIAMEHLNNIRI